MNSKEQKAKEFLTACGINCDNPELRETPRRIVDLLKDMTEGVNINIGFYFKRTLSVKHNQMIVIKDIEFVSMCCHHLWPFFGKVHIAYIPNKKIVGLSKFLSAVRAISRRPQVQETMNQELANVINEKLEPKGVMVVIEGTHTCMLVGGKFDYGMPAHTNSKTITSCCTGVFLDLDATRAEALTLMGVK